MRNVVSDTKFKVNNVNNAEKRDTHKQITICKTL